MGHDSATKSPMEKKKKKKSLSHFSYLFQFHISNFKILSLTVLDSMQSGVTHGSTHARTDKPKSNMPLQPQLLRSWGHND